MEKEPSHKPSISPVPESNASRRLRWIRNYLAAFAISLLIGFVIEHVTSHDFLEGAYQAQQRWIDAVYNTTPGNVARTYWSELKGDPSDGARSPRVGLYQPFMALLMTVSRVYSESGVALIIQIALGALTVAVINYRRRGGIFFESGLNTLIFGPIAVIAAAIVLGLPLWYFMIGSLKLLSGVTGLAAAAAGATGIGAAVWRFFAKLGEKGAEHVLVPHV